MRRPKLSYANVTATLALFVALGGTSYAVTQLPRNSVGSAQLRANAVTSAKIRAGGVTRADLAASALPAGRGPRGAEGPAGPAGPSGPSGPIETIQVKRPGQIGIASAAGAQAQLAALTLEPGTWTLDGVTVLTYSYASAVSERFDCSLITATGDTLTNGFLQAGNEPGSVTSGPIPLRVSVRLSVTTQVSLRCRHANPASGNPYFFNTTLGATRIAQLEDR